MLMHVPKLVPAVKRLQLPSSWKRADFLDPTGEIFVGSFYSNIDYLYANHCSWHTDKGFPPYSALLVVRNTGVAVHSWGKPSVVATSGDLIFMNIHKSHKATQIKKNGRLLALVKDYDKMVPIDQIKKDFVEVLDSFKMQVPKDVVY